MYCPYLKGYMLLPPTSKHTSLLQKNVICWQKDLQRIPGKCSTIEIRSRRFGFRSYIFKDCCNLVFFNLYFFSPGVRTVEHYGFIMNAFRSKLVSLSKPAKNTSLLHYRSNIHKLRIRNVDLLVLTSYDQLL
jgi:hypothetical protein